MTGELAAAVLFPLLWIFYIPTFEWSSYYLTTYTHIFAFVVLEYILFQGSLYWFLKWKRVKEGQKALLTTSQRQLFRFFRSSNLLLLAIGIPVLFFQATQFSKGLYWFLFLYGFAIVEYINYYHIRLSYMSSEEIRDFIRQRGFRRSVLSRELVNK